MVTFLYGDLFVWWPFCMVTFLDNAKLKNKNQDVPKVKHSLDVTVAGLDNFDNNYIFVIIRTV